MKRYYTADKETGSFIDSFETYAEATEAIKAYEAEDEANGDYTPDFYDIVDEEHMHIEQ